MLHLGHSKDNDNAQDGEKKLGVSKLVYGLGMAARDSLVAFFVATAAFFVPFYYGQNKEGSTLDKIAKTPENIKKFFMGKNPEKTGRVGNALAVAAGLGTIVGYIAHLPGLIRGPRIVKEAEDKYHAEIKANKELSEENDALTLRLKQQAIELAQANEKLGPYTQKVINEKEQQAQKDNKPESLPEGKTSFVARTQTPANDDPMQARA